jgi:hypothetical protein
VLRYGARVSEAVQDEIEYGIAADDARCAELDLQGHSTTLRNEVVFILLLDRIEAIINRLCAEATRQQWSRSDLQTELASLQRQLAVQTYDQKDAAPGCPRRLSRE